MSNLPTINSVFFEADEDTEASEIIPLFNNSVEDDAKIGKSVDELPILPVRNMVMFPGVIVPVTVTRQKAIKLIKKVNPFHT